ncbi:biotin synthase auxiliary protein BsaP [Streptosporangium saharense]|uniref:biotin synthase auxiliary protein BsaP n=1 Tax=Streptosporangium saharense TaxID=1706840 RepID=UPI00406D4F22
MMSSRARIPGASVMRASIGSDPVTPYCDHCGRPTDEGDHAACLAARAFEPPRYCSRCRRRMVVQVTVRGWSARCSEHGSLSG